MKRRCACPAIPGKPELQSSLHLSSLYRTYICMYRLYIRTELDVRQQGAAFGSQVRHGRRLQCHPGGQADVEGAFYLWQGGGGRGASYDAVTQIGCKIVLT